MLVYKRPPNIRNLLIRAKLPPTRTNRTLREKLVGFRRCSKRTKCRLCPYTGLAPGEIVGKVVVQHSGEEIPIKSTMDCQTQGLIYVLLCKKCHQLSKLPQQYLGQSEKIAEERFVGHLNTVKGNFETKTPFGQHFRQGSHSPADIQFTPFEKVYSRDPFIRRAREAHYINQHEFVTHGMNLQL